MNSDVRKSYFKGMQAKKWSEILAHPFFTELVTDELSYEWVSDNDDSEHQSKVRSIVYSIFIERSSVLFQADLTLIWLKQTIGHLLNCIDSNEVDQIEFISKVISLVPQVPFTLERY